MRDIGAQSVTLQVRKRMLLEGAQGLAFLHSRGIVHLDVKPQNLLVSVELVATSCDHE